MARLFACVSLACTVACADDVAAPDSAIDAGAPDELAPPASEVTEFVPGPVSMRRLTRAQYLGTVRGMFGDELEILEPREVDVRLEGLTTIGATTASVTPAGIEGYDATARQVASAVLAGEGDSEVVPCEPADEEAPDDECAEAFVSEVAPLVLRRALREGESERFVQLARLAADGTGTFRGGLEAVLAGWLMSPEFLFIQERIAPDAEGPFGSPLTAESLASRLSYFLWNQAPDAELLAAAADGSLLTEAGYRAQLDRLIGDEVRLERGLRTLFGDLLELDELAHVGKDLTTYPAFTAAAVEDAREQTLRTVVDHLLVQRADYRDLFTTRRTFMTRHLGPIYGVPVAEEWEPYEFPEGGPRAGIQTHMSLLSLHARARRSSPVLRGLFVLESLLCITIPPPPPDVSFEGVAPGGANAPTARERLAVHRADPACSSCHDLIDPIGLALENFDAIGQFRTHEAGVAIETYGELFGNVYADVRGFHGALRDSPVLTQCMVDKLFMHAVGREAVAAERPLLASLHADFARDGYDFVALMRNVALSHGFRAASGAAESERSGTGVEGGND